MSNFDSRLLVPEDMDAYNPNMLNERDLATMDAEEVFQFNNAGEVFETIEELLELLKTSGNAPAYDIDQILIKLLTLKSKLHLTAIPL
jgi:hypothetical protein